MSLSEKLGLKKAEIKREEKDDWDDPEYCLEAVRQDGLNLRFVKNQTPEICLEAVKKSGTALYYIEKQTPELCLIAVKENGHALEHAREQTLELCLAAVKQNGWALKYVKNQTPELCLIAVKQNGHALKYVKNQTPELCLIAVRQYGLILEHIREQTLELIQTAIKQNMDAVNFINTNILPIKDWDVEWFKYLSNIELKRQFIRERGKEVFQQLRGLEVTQEDEEYCLVRFKYNRDQEDFQKALIFECPSTNDVYFTEVPKETEEISDALKFLNNGVSKEELAYES